MEGIEIREIKEFFKLFINKRLRTYDNYKYRASEIKIKKGLYFICNENDKVYYIGQSGFRKNGSGKTSCISERMKAYAGSGLFNLLIWLGEYKDDERSKFDKYYNEVITKLWKVKVLPLPNVLLETEARLIEDFCTAIYDSPMNNKNKRSSAVSATAVIFRILQDI